MRANWSKESDNDFGAFEIAIVLEDYVLAINESQLRKTLSSGLNNSFDI